jgi:hypothetical protein
MTSVTLRLERDVRGSITVWEGGASADIGRVVITPAETAIETSKKRKLEDESEAGADEYETIQVTVSIQVARKQPTASVLRESDGDYQDRQKTELDAFADSDAGCPVLHGASKADADNEENWRAEYDSVTSRINRKIADIAEQPCPNDHEYLKSYETPLSKVVHGIEGLLGKADRHHGTKKGAYACEKAYEAMAELFEGLISFKLPWSAKIKTTAKLTMSRSGLDVAAFGKIDDALSRLMRTRLLYYPLAHIEIYDDDPADIRDLVEHWHRRLDGIAKNLDEVLDVSRQLFPKSWKILHGVWKVRGEPVGCYSCGEYALQLENTNSLLKTTEEKLKRYEFVYEGMMH